MKKSVLELVCDAESLYNAVGKAKASASDRIKRANSDKYSREYRLNETTAARNAYTDSKQSAILQLSKIRDALPEAAESEAPVLRTNMVDQNLATLLRLPLTARDYSALAKTHINNYTAIRMLEASARENGFVLKAHRTPEETAEAAGSYINRLIKCIEDDNTSWDAELPSTKGVFLNDSRQYFDKMSEPIKAADIECHGADLESAIIAGLNKERSVTADEDFERGFTGKAAKPVDYSSFPALSEISAKLAEVRLPQKSERVLNGLWAVIDSKRLRDGKPLSAQEIKAASDRTQDEALSAELRELADLFTENGLRFSPAPGTEKIPITDRYNEKARHELQKREAVALQNKESSAQAHSIAANTVAKNNEARQARREDAERQRYESVKTVDRTDANDTP